MNTTPHTPLPAPPPPPPAPMLQCYGFVTYASPAEAEELLQFSAQQGVWVDDEVVLTINWAQGPADKARKVGGRA